MKKKKTIIFTEGSNKIGIGHITRCIALYDELSANHFDVLFVVNGNKSIAPLLKGKKHRICNWLINRQERDAIIKDSVCVVIDSYLAKLADYYDVMQKTRLLVCVDDFDRLPYPSGLVIKASSHSVHRPTAIRQTTELTGNQYQLLRKDFIQIPPFIVRKKPHTILITFGGDDIRRLTPAILTFLTQNYPLLKKIVIIGPAYKNDNTRRINAHKDHRTKIINNASAKEMRDAMLKSDIAISAGGQTLNELARIGLPTICIQVADNQKLHLQNWELTGFVKNLGDYQTDLLEKLHHAMVKLLSLTVRKKMSRLGQRTVDGKGPKRIVSAINKIISP